MAGHGPDKSDAAFRTIGELSRQTGLPQHVLRYWETRFPQLKPVQRAGNRRYYRPEDVALVTRIDTLLNREGYTIRGVQKLLSEPPANTPTGDRRRTHDLAALRGVRDMLAQAIAADT